MQVLWDVVPARFNATTILPVPVITNPVRQLVQIHIERSPKEGLPQAPGREIGPNLYLQFQNRTQALSQGRIRSRQVRGHIFILERGRGHREQAPVAVIPQHWGQSMMANRQRIARFGKRSIRFGCSLISTRSIFIAHNATRAGHRYPDILRERSFPML
ncbi:hypothetical protein RJZ56_006809 [Blastomyces dermatitidis]